MKLTFKNNNNDDHNNNDIINANNKDKSNLLNNLLNKSKSYFIKSFSVKREYFPFFVRFLEKCEREHWDFSYAVNLAIKEFVERHCVPNPQVTLDRCFIGLPAKPHNVCCVPNCNRKIRYRLQLSNYKNQTMTFQVCELHKNWRHKDYPILTAFKDLEEQ